MDEGDLVVRTPNTDARIVLEAKNRGQVSLPQFLREAADESALYAHNRGIPQADTFGVAVVKAGPGIAAFGAVVVLTMLATMSFDARRAWDPRFRPGLLHGRRPRRANPGVVSGRAG